MRVLLVTNQPLLAHSFLLLGQEKYSDIFFSLNKNDPNFIPDIVLIDSKHLNGKRLKAIIEKYREYPVFLIAGRETKKSLYGTQNISGIFPYEVSIRKIITSLRLFHNPVQPYCPEPYSTLNTNELIVYDFIREGCSDKEIARTLAVNISTVKYHVRQVCRKFGVKNRTQAALMTD
jgi:DNA-binding CsgD family transcriptional regulator